MKKKKYTQAQIDRAIRKVARNFNFWNATAFVSETERFVRQHKLNMSVYRLMQKTGTVGLKP